MTAVVKIGGGLTEEPGEGFWGAVGALRERGPVVVVHGGGSQATALARRLGHEPRLVHGRRVTTDTDLAIVQWTMRGEISTRICREAFRRGIPAVGVSGVDGGILQVERRPPWLVDGEEVDFGWVGDVRQVDPALLLALIAGGFMPVLSPLGVSGEGEVFNVNADTVAVAVATALGADELLFATEAGGLRGAPSAGSPILPVCDWPLFEAGRSAGWIADGMLVKLRVAFEAVAAGVPSVWIADPGDLLLRARATRVAP